MFDVFLMGLEELRESIQAKQTNEDDHFFNSNDFSSEERRLEELRQDIADLARQNGHEGLFEKLLSLAPEDQLRTYHQASEPSELSARIIRIDRIVRTFGPSLAAQEPSKPTFELQSAVRSESPSKGIFVVHGHDDAVLHEVSRLISGLGLDPIVLREMPNHGRTVIEKFEVNAQVGFAVILMTSDDMGASLEDVETGKYQPRARQNVILELGYFFGKLSRSRVCVLKSKNVEQPSDILGVVYNELDSAGAWRLALGKELKAAGYDVDLNAL